MKRLAVLILLFCIVQLISIPLQASTSNTSRAFTIGSKTSQGMHLQFQVPDFEIETQNVGGTVYNKIRMDKVEYLAEAGMPELPTLSTMIAIPNHGSVHISATNAHEKMINHILPYPSQMGNDNPNSRNFDINQAYYQGTEVFPQESIRYGDPQILRDFRIISVQVQPFAWDAATHNLIVRDQIDIDLQFTDEPGINELDGPQTISSSFENIYESFILNFDDYRSAMHANTPAKIVMIYNSAASADFVTKLNTFALWKKQKGADVRLVSTQTTGASNSAIKAYLQGLYNDPMSRPDFIVLVGDADGSWPIPAFNVNGNGDYPYTHLAGGDLLGDCFIGRISVENTSQLDVVLAKIYAYEKTINVASAQWLNKMLLVGDPAHSGQSVINTNRYIHDLALQYNPNYTFTELYMANPPIAQFDQAINQGIGFFDYRGYIGMSGWAPSTSLINGVKLPHAVIITCYTGPYVGQTSTTEALIRLGTAAAPAGSVTAIGMDTSATHTLFNNVLTGGVFDGIFAQHMRTMGEALLNGKLYEANIYGATQQAFVETFTQWCNLMGDPTMEVYITIPHTFNSTVDTNLPAGTSVYNLTITDESNVPVENACVTVTQSGTVIGRAYTDSNGLAILNLSTMLAAGDAVFVVSKHDYKPLISTVAVSPAGSLVASTILVDDDNAGGSQGNSNSIANSGETVQLLFSLRNSTSAAISGVTGTISSTNPYVVIDNGAVDFGSIAAANSQFSTEPIVAHISASTPNNTNLIFNISATDDSANTYNVSAVVAVTDAFMRFSSLAIIDGNNQTLDAGETATLNLTVNNIGAVSISDVQAELHSLNDLIVVQDSLGSFGTINQNASATTTADNFILHGRNLLLPGMVIPMQLRLFTNAGFEQMIDFYLNVGVVTVNTPLGPDAYGYVIYDDGDTAFSDCPTYQWVGIAPAEGGSGTPLAINDPDASGEGDGVGAQSIADVTLPFTFQFYGRDYTTMSVCSNGFIAMGHTDNTEFRNYRLPGGQGPSPMIAPFWDDLATGNGSAVYSYYDAAQHYFVVEWYNMINGFQNSAHETFEVILYDPAYYPTSLGDGPIKIQYNTFNNVDNGTGTSNHGNYSTIGIENHYQDTGLEYTFNNVYPTAASPLGNNRALYITNIPIYHENAYLVLGQTIIHDGNNSIVEPGETIQLGQELLNIGNNSTANVTATLSTTDTNVTINTAEANYYPIAGDGNGVNRTPFTFTVSPNCPANHAITFSLNIVSGLTSWTRSFSIAVVKPELAYRSFFLNDMAGDNDGVADPNEDIMVITNVKNTSDVPAHNLMGTLTTTVTGVTISDAVQIKPLVQGGDVIQFAYPVHVGATVPVNTYMNFAFVCGADAAANVNAQFSVGVGMSGLNEDFETDNGDFVPAGGFTWGVPTNGINAHSGTHVWGTSISGNYPDNANYSMTSPTFPIGSNSTLSFWHILNCEGGYDGGNVSVSTDGGNNWTVIAPTSGGSYIPNISSMNQPGFSAGPANWTQVTFSLSAFANSNIKLRWHFTSDVSVNSTGWFIDDVMLTGYSEKSGIVQGQVTLSNDSNPDVTRISTADNMVTYPDSTGLYKMYLPMGSFTLTGSIPYYQSAVTPSFTVSDTQMSFNYNLSLTYLSDPTSLVAVCLPNSPIISLSWAAPADPVYPVLSYKVYRKMGPGLYSMIANPTANVLTYDDNPVLDGDYTYYVRAVYAAGEGAPSNEVTQAFPVVGTGENPQPVLVTKLNANYPNPFNPLTTISYSVAKAGRVTLDIYNVRGQHVKTLVQQSKAAGRYSVQWNGMDEKGSPVGSGMYFYRLKAGDYTSTRKMMLLK